MEDILLKCRIDVCYCLLLWCGCWEVDWWWSGKFVELGRLLMFVFEFLWCCKVCIRWVFWLGLWYCFIFVCYCLYCWWWEFFEWEVGLCYLWVVVGVCFLWFIWCWFWVVWCGCKFEMWVVLWGLCRCYMWFFYRWGFWCC